MADTQKLIDTLRKQTGQLQQKLSTHVAKPLAAWAERVHLREKVMKVLPQDLAKSLPRTFEPLAVAEFGSQLFQRQGAAFYGKLATLLLSTYFLADVSALLVERFIPEPPLARGVSLRAMPPRASRGAEDYAAIWNRNLFNSQGLIPGEEQGNGQDQGGQPVRTNLPFNLVGTLVLHDELKSIATIEDKSASQVYPVRVDDEIPGKARILKVEATRVVFVNVATGRREFVEMPEDALGSGPRIQVGSAQGSGGAAGTGPGVDRQGNTFNVARTEVDKTLADFNNVLTQARAVPNFENGVPQGYKLFQIVPGSIYEKLGLKNGDVIMGLNGESINDPAKAFELLGQLKNGASNLDLSIKRDGRVQNFNYNIH